MFNLVDVSIKKQKNYVWFRVPYHSVHVSVSCRNIVGGGGGARGMVSGMTPRWNGVFLITFQYKSIKKSLQSNLNVTTRRFANCSDFPLQLWEIVTMRYPLFIINHDLFTMNWIIITIVFFIKAARPLISVYSEKGEVTKATVSLPAVFRAPIRPDIVSFVHSEIRKNSRQPYAVSEKAGE